MGSALKVLVIDDEPDILKLVDLALCRVAGFRVVAASSGAEGVAAAARELPDVVLLDLMLRGQGGLAVLHDLRASAANAHTPVVVLSARPDDDEQIRACLAGGAWGVIRKPFDPLTLASRIREHLEGGERRRA